MVAFMGHQYLYKYVRYKGYYTRYCIKYSSNNISIFSSSLLIVGE